MPPKFALAERSKKVAEKPLEEKKFGAFPVLLKAPILAPGKAPFLLDEEQSRLQKISEVEKLRFISNAEDIESSTMPLLSIVGVNFSILNKEVLDKISVVDVSSKISRTDDIFTGCETGNLTSMYFRSGCTRAVEPLPPENSITSYTEMGVVENNLLCPKCNKTNMDCPGHLGQISLNKHYIHPMFMEYAIWTLISVCNSCSKSLVSESYMKQTGIDRMSGASRLRTIAEVAKNCRCENAKTANCVPNPEYILKNIKDSYKVKYIISKKDKDSPNVKEIEDIEKILDSITPEDANLLGFSHGAHPRDMIMKSFPVIPPCARPFIIRDGQRKEDHLTTCYDEIVRDNFKYARSNPEAKVKGYETKKDEEGFEANCRRRYERDLHFHISHFIDNSDGKYCRSPTEKIRGIKQRIVKKEGLIRGNIMGKRVNFCGRSVFGPDSALKFGEVAIPESMAKVLTIPEKIHEKNLDFILDLWKQKKIVNIYLGYSSAKNRRLAVKDKDYINIDGKQFLPKIGDTVDRHMMDGDIVLLNRQPTLYKYSLIGDRVKLVNRKTIGLHMVESKMRQADFDGDEGNIHVIQALDARVEAMTFANVCANVQSALKNGSMIGVIYNGLSSVYMMTNKNPEVLLTKDEIEEAHSILSNKNYLDSLPARLKKHKVNPLSGRALFSSLLPPDFYYKGAEGVLIKDGVLIEGQITSSHVGSKSGTIQSSIWKWYGQDTTVAFITDCTFLTDWFISIYGLSFGYEDICPDEQTRKMIADKIEKETQEAQAQIDLLGPETPSMTLLERLERENKILKFSMSAAENSKGVIKNLLTPTNPLKIMQESGAKGSDANTSGILALIGQITVTNRRPRRKLSQETRCLPYFEYNTEDIFSRGFVQNNYLNGLTPAEMYFLSETSREGVSNTALTTPDTGSMHHRLVKVMEDVKVDYDGSVRNARGTIYQFSYYDGYEVSEMVSSNSESTGRVASFLNLEEAVNRINAKY